MGSKTGRNVMLLFLALWLAACQRRASSPTPLPPFASPTVAAPTATPSATSAPTDTAIPPSPTATRAPYVTALPNPTEYTWTLVVQGLQRPVGVYSLPGDERLFVLEQEGRIRLVSQGQILATPFLDIRDRVGSRASEQGLLGLAFHPHYASNGFFFVNYTDRDGNTVVSRMRVSADPQRGDPTTEKPLLYIVQPYANHNGGHIVFGPDGYLYIGTGDGGAAGDPHGNAQNLNTLLGKLLRLDVDRGDPYAIPPDNPFAQGGGRPEIWALGLRNPWQFAFDPLNGDLYIADVGQNLWEEVDYLPAGTPGGVNLGWDYREGFHPFEGEPPPGIQLTDPVWEYGHDQGCSITGGVVYRGQSLPAFWGVYLFGDYCTGTVWGLLRYPDGQWKAQALFHTGARIAAFGVDGQGEVLLVDHQGALYRLTRR